MSEPPFPEQANSEPEYPSPQVPYRRSSYNRERVTPVNRRQLGRLMDNNEGGMSEREAISATLGAGRLFDGSLMNEENRERFDQKWGPEAEMGHIAAKMAGALPPQKSIIPSIGSVPPSEYQQASQERGERMASLQDHFNHQYLLSRHGKDLGIGFKYRNAYPNYDEPGKE